MVDLLADLEFLNEQPSGERVLALERIIPRDTVQEILQQTGHASRHCPRLPHWFMVFYVISLGLFCRDNYRQVYKWLQRFRPLGTPQRNTLAEARKGLGIPPLRYLAQRIVRLLCPPDTPGAFYKGLRLMALDGFVLDLPDSEANDRTFGRPQSGRGAGAFPQVRVLALCETGSHVLLRWLIKPLRWGEVSMASWVLRGLTQGMLLLWDRNFLSYRSLQQVQQQGGQLLARLKSNFLFEPIQVLADGSFLAKMYPSSWDRKKDRNGILVRIVEYTLQGCGHADEGKVHRLLTTLLDAEQYPAKELIVLYHERWEEELAIDELKTHQRERPVLRSQTPAGVIQEIEGLLLAHFVIRTLMHEAAQSKGLDQDRLSFTATLKILRCRLPEVPKDANDQAGREQWFANLLEEISEEVLPVRRQRINPRVIKRKMSKWKKKRPQHRNPPRPAKTVRESINIRCSVRYCD